VTHLKQKETEDHEVAGIRSLTWKTTMNCCKYGSESETQNAYRSQLSKRRNLFVPSQIRFTSSSFRIHKRARKRERERERGVIYQREGMTRANGMRLQRQVWPCFARWLSQLRMEQTEFRLLLWTWLILCVFSFSTSSFSDSDSVQVDWLLKIRCFQSKLGSLLFGQLDPAISVTNKLVFFLANLLFISSFVC